MVVEPIKTGSGEALKMSLQDGLESAEVEWTEVALANYLPRLPHVHDACTR
jgi:hypothetical protein